MTSLRLPLALLYLRTVLLLAVPSLTRSGLALSGEVVHVPLERGASTPFKTARHRHDIDRRQGFGEDFVSYNEAAWFGTFTVGASNLSLLIDTGSSSLLVNHGGFMPSTRTLDLERTEEWNYGVAYPNGSKATTDWAEIRVQLYADDVSYQHLTVKNFTFGTQYNEPIQIPMDGLIGFAGTDQPNETTFFESLCDQGSVQECRFGLALWDDGIGTQILGGVDRSRFAGPLSVAPVQYFDSAKAWILSSDVVIDGDVLFQNVTVLMDSGTANIIGPMDQVLSVYEKLGITPVWYDTTENSHSTWVDGYYPCDIYRNFGFAFPSQYDVAVLNPISPVSNQSQPFYLTQMAFSSDEAGPNNCTSVISGSNMTNGLWIVGQAFFQGKYVDHNFATETMGFATLRPELYVNSTAADVTRNLSSSPLVWLTVVMLGVVGASLLTSG